MNKLVFLFLAAALSSLTTPMVLAQGDAEAGASKIALCATCHGADGNSEIPMNPKLAGQSASYLAKQLRNYQSGERQNAIMAGMAATLSEQDILDISAYYAAQKPTLEGADPELLELGEALYRSGNPELGVAACSACHAPTGAGNGPAGFPALGGQHVEYTLQQLQMFRSGERANDLNGMMRTTVERLTDSELEALASYVSGLH